MTLTLIAGAFIAALSLACQTPSPPAPSPTTTAAALPAPPPASIPGRPTPVTHQLMVVADPSGSARFLLNSVPLDQAQYAPGEQVTIDVLPEAGWEIGEWVGPVYDVTGNTAKVDLVVSQAVVVRLKNKESSTSTSTAGPTDTPLPEPTPKAALKPAATPTATPPLTAPPTPIRLESLVIEPSILVFRSKGETHAVTATGVYSDGSSQDITGASFGTVYNAGDSRIAEVSLTGS